MYGYGTSHEQRNWMIAFVLPIQIVTTLLLWIRLLSRFHRSGGQPGFDDVLVFVGWVLGTGLSATVLLGMANLFQKTKVWTDCVTGTYQYGYNRHIWDVPFDLWPKAALVLPPLCCRDHLQVVVKLTRLDRLPYRDSLPLQYLFNQDLCSIVLPAPGLRHLQP